MKLYQYNLDGQHLTEFYEYEVDVDSDRLTASQRIHVRSMSHDEIKSLILSNHQKLD
jgi:hypothetical protein